MHLTAYENATVFYTEYIYPKVAEGQIPFVVEFGSYDVNGSLRPIFQGCEYVGLDLEAGKGVDVVVSSGEKTPIMDACADAVLSSSNFEHDECFWMTFLEMCRILKPKQGLLYINAPSAGPYHGYPGDCWRFYKDSWSALAKWAKRNGYDVEIVETYVDVRGGWQDNVCVFMRA